MNKYVIYFSKKGYLKYTSHLDMQRLFKRAFRRSGIILQYSCGFNPHPKMSFAQPLSLGYLSDGEMLEFESPETYDKAYIIDNLSKCMPMEIVITGAAYVDEGVKTVAASVISAKYTVTLPVSYYSKDFNSLTHAYIDQESIIAEKKQKKTKKLIEVDIKSKIQSILPKKNEQDQLLLEMVLDSGSSSNLSPELVIKTFVEFCDLACERYDIEVVRNKINLPVDFPIHEM